MKVRLVCGNCATIGVFDSWQAAYDQGWDTVLHFGYNACNRCPGVSVYFPMLYAQQAREARAAGDEDKARELEEKAAAATMEFAPHERRPPPWRSRSC